MHAQEALPVRLPGVADWAEQLGQVPGRGYKKALQGDVHPDPHLHNTRPGLDDSHLLACQCAHAPAQRMHRYCEDRGIPTYCQGCKKCLR